MIESLSDIQSEFSLPEFDRAIVDGFEQGNYSDAYRLDVGRLTSDLFCHTPPNFLPLVSSDVGDCMGFYFPKGHRAKPFAAVQFLTANMELYPLECELGDVFRKPHLMEFACSEGELEDNWEYLKGCPEWADLVIAPNTDVVELNDLLKPMSLNWRFLTALGRRTTGVLPTGQAIFRGKRDFLEIDKWMELADYLESEGDFVGALKALENSIAVIWRYPNYGGFKSDEVEKECEKIWRKVATYEGLDGFDQAMVKSMIRAIDKGA